VAPERRSLAALVDRRRAILAAAARLVKPGGRLVYATCSVLDAEGEAVARDFEHANSVRFIRVPVAADACGAPGSTTPSARRGDSFVSGRIATQPTASSRAIWQRA
jgi:16S rRNA C967 or C1407 C5-methylase (RsmB/RsmF family)